MIIDFLRKKFIRLKNSSKVLRFYYYYHCIFHDKKLGNIGFDFTKKKSRKDIVQEIIEIKDFKKYLEIGCFDDELFNHIKCLKKVGVDPVSGGTIRKTSDQFFSSNKEFFDCIFIDGLHEFKQVRRDILNSLKFLNEGGIILLHDCLPNNYFEQAIPRCQWTWNGDVWKAIVEFRKSKDVDVYTCYADYGIGVIIKRPNRNLLNFLDKDVSSLKFDDYFYNHQDLMNIIEHDKLIKII
tara:strand:- start:879 stop:1592 length:714 start_codon:yes stop_codon:yes gene_type:complete